MNSNKNLNYKSSYSFKKCLRQAKIKIIFSIKESLIIASYHYRDRAYDDNSTWQNAIGTTVSSNYSEKRITDFLFFLFKPIANIRATEGWWMYSE